MTAMQEKQDKIAKDLYHGVFQRYLPQRLTKEIEALILERFVKDECSYILTFSDMHQEELAPKQEFLLVRELRFRVRNFTLSPAKFPLKSRIQNPIEADKAGMKVVTGHLALWEGGTDRTSELNSPVPSPGQAHVAEVSVDVEVPPEGTSELIVLVSQEIVSFSKEENFYTQNTATTGLRVEVRNELESKVEITGVKMMHGDNSFSKDAGPGDNYCYLRGILPGQGFMVTWKNNT
jgi:hypothetical protein